MKGMKLRAATLLWLLVIAGVISVVTPTAQAGQWVGEIDFKCEAKRTAGPGLFFPTVNPSSPGTLFTIECGKHKSDKHATTGVSIPESCHSEWGVSLNGKKPAAGTQTPSNCTINILAHVQGNCSASNGQLLGSIQINLASGGSKIIVLDLEGADQVQWTNSAGPTKLVSGNTSKGMLMGKQTWVQDQTNKSESCASTPGNDGADAFKIEGAGTITGVKPK